MKKPALNYLKIVDQVQHIANRSGRSPQEITVIAVTKNQPVEHITEVYENGCRNFGESRVQEALPKISHLPEDCHWHFIGNLQSNKIAKVLTPFSLIHSVDSFDLAKKISRLSEKNGYITSILLEVNTSRELSKHGLKAEEWQNLLDEINRLDHIKIKGLMTMAPLTEDQNAIRHCFRQLYSLRELWKNRMKDPTIFKELSMGMSQDYAIAIEEGATLLRIGTKIFTD